MALSYQFSPIEGSRHFSTHLFRAFSCNSSSLYRTLQKGDRPKISGSDPPHASLRRCEGDGGGSRGSGPKDCSYVMACFWRAHFRPNTTMMYGVSIDPSDCSDANGLPQRLRRKYFGLFGSRARTMRHVAWVMERNAQHRCSSQLRTYRKCCTLMGFRGPSL